MAARSVPGVVPAARIPQAASSWTRRWVVESGRSATCATSVIVKERPELKLRMIATTLLVTLRRGSEPLPATDTLSFVHLW